MPSLPESTPFEASTTVIAALMRRSGTPAAKAIRGRRGVSDSLRASILVKRYHALFGMDIPKHDLFCFTSKLT